MKEAQSAQLENNDLAVKEQTMQQPIYTTLNRIKAHSPCEPGWYKLLTHMGKTRPDDEPLKFTDIVESNDVPSAIWALRSICPEQQMQVRHFAVKCAERVLPIYLQAYPDDKRLQEVLDLAFAYSEGKADITQLQEMEDSFEEPDPKKEYKHFWDRPEKEVAASDFVVNAVEATVSPRSAYEAAIYAARFADLAVNFANIEPCDNERQAQATLLMQCFS